MGVPGIATVKHGYSMLIKKVYIPHTVDYKDLTYCRLALSVTSQTSIAIAEISAGQHQMSTNPDIEIIIQAQCKAGQALHCPCILIFLVYAVTTTTYPG